MGYKILSVIQIVVPVVAILLCAVILGTVIKGEVENAANEIESGIIVDKEMSAGYTSYNSGKNGSHMQSVPASWHFTIRGDKNGEIVDYRFNVSEDEYNKYKIGEEYHR